MCMYLISLPSGAMCCSEHPIRVYQGATAEELRQAEPWHARYVRVVLWRVGIVVMIAQGHHPGNVVQLGHGAALDPIQVIVVRYPRCLGTSLAYCWNLFSLQCTKLQKEARFGHVCGTYA